MLFVDASALVKRYVRERHSVKVRRFLTAGPIAISRLSEVEVPSALARLVRERRLPPRSRDRAVTAFVTDIAAWHVVEITADVTALARTLLHRHDLRAAMPFNWPARSGCDRPSRCQACWHSIRDSSPLRRRSNCRCRTSSARREPFPDVASLKGESPATSHRPFSCGRVGELRAGWVRRVAGLKRRLTSRARRISRHPSTALFPWPSPRGSQSGRRA